MDRCAHLARVTVPLGALGHKRRKLHPANGTTGNRATPRDAFRTTGVQMHRLPLGSSVTKKEQSGLGTEPLYDPVAIWL